MKHGGDGDDHKIEVLNMVMLNIWWWWMDEKDEWKPDGENKFFLLLTTVCREVDALVH